MQEPILLPVKVLVMRVEVVCVCVRARACMCMCVCVCVRARAHVCGFIPDLLSREWLFKVFCGQSNQLVKEAISKTEVFSLFFPFLFSIVISLRHCVEIR